MSEAVFTLLQFLCGIYLAWRQRKVCCITRSLPPEMTGIMDEITFEQARLYTLHKIHFSMAKDIFSVIIQSSVIHFRGMYVFLGVAEILVGSLGINKSGPLLSATLMVIMSTFNILVALPFDVYFNFVLEETYGFNRMTAGYYVKEQLKSLILSEVFTFLAAFGAIYIIKNGGDYFYIYLWFLCAAVLIMFASLYVIVVVPIFHSFVPFPDQGMVPYIQQLFQRVNFPFSRLRVLQTSVKSTHTNAFFSGISMTKTVVLYDTLLHERRWDIQELLAILGHEMGHWKLNHILKLIAIYLLVLLGLLVVFSTMIKEAIQGGQLVSRFFNPNRSVVFHILANVFAHRLSFMRFGLSWMSRSFEYEADTFAASLGLASPLCTALIKIHNANLVFPVHDWLYAKYHYHHPTLLHRLQALRRSE